MNAERQRNLNLSMFRKLLIIFLLLFPAFAGGTNAPISSLPTASTLTGSELVPLVQGGVTSKSTAQAIANLAPGGGGGGTPGGSNTYVQYNGSGAFTGDINFTYVSPGALTLGSNSRSTGILNLSGTTNGTVTIQPQGAAGTYNFNLPTSAGTSGLPLISGGGGTAPMTWGDISVSGGGTGLATLTSGIIYKGNGTSPIAASALSDNGTLVTSTEPFDVTTNSYVIELANAGTTGTTLNKLVKVSSGGKALIAATTDTSGIIGVVIGGAGTTGNAQIATGGTASCVFDATAASGDYVGISSGTAGDCTDVGSALPTSGESIGRVTVGGSGAGTYTMIVNPGSTFITNNSTGATGNVQTSNGSGGFSNFALPITIPQGGLGLTSIGTNGTYLQSNGTSYVFASGTVATGTGVPGGAATQIQYNNSGGNFGGLTSFYVQSYGAVCNGSTADTTAIQNTINAALAAGGGTVIFPPGTCESATLTLPSKIQIRGANFGGTTLQLANSTNADLLIGANYNTLTGTNSTAGINQFSIVDITLDGNSSHNTATAGAACGATTGTSGGIKIYGYNFYTDRVQITNFAGCGWYSEWSTAADIGGEEMEANLHDMKISHNGGLAMYWNGPHDSKISYLYMFYNTLGGFYYTGVGSPVHMAQSHGYQNPNWDWELDGPNFYCLDCFAEGGITIRTGGGNTPAFVFTQSQINNLTMGVSGHTCSDGPYKMWFDDTVVNTITNYSGCGFQDEWTGGAVGTISGLGLGTYTADTSVGVIGLQDRTFNSKTFLTDFQNVVVAAVGNSFGTNFTITNNGIQNFLANNIGQVEIGTSTPISGTLLGIFGDADLKASSYLNWGLTDGTAGYGLRDNAGTLQFKNNGGSWTNLGSVTYPASGDIIVSTGTTSAPSGIAPVNGLCIVGAGGAWGAGACSGVAGINLGTSATATNPQIVGDPSSGFYTAGAALIDIAVSGSKMIEWSTVGETLEKALNVIGKITYGGPVNVHTHNVTSGSSYSVSATTDYFICVNKGSGSATNILLPNAPTPGDLYIIKDCKGDAGSNNITISPTGATIDGASNVLINSNYGVDGVLAISSSAWVIE